MNASLTYDIHWQSTLHWLHGTTIDAAEETVISVYEGQSHSGLDRSEDSWRPAGLLRSPKKMHSLLRLLIEVTNVVSNMMVLLDQ